MKSNATLKIILDPNDKSERRLLKLRVTFERKPHLYSLNADKKLSEAEFANDKLKVHKDAMNEAKKAYDIAESVVDRLGKDFSFEKFKKEYRERVYGIKKELKTFSDVADDYISKLDEHSTRQNYKTSAKWIEKYRSGSKIESIDNAFVDSLVAFMKENGLSENSIRLYCRQLKAIYQSAINSGIMQGSNPFTRYAKRSIGRSISGLTDEELTKFLQFAARTQREEFGKDFFLLSLACSGANIGDILSFKNQDIQGKTIVFIRRKTKKNPIPVVIPLLNYAKGIFNKYGRINLKKPNNYILPYLAGCTNDVSTRNKIHDVIKRINKGLEELCLGAGLRKITTYDARHAYATLARDKGMSDTQLQKMLGHSSSKTTASYLGKLSHSILEKNEDVLNQLLEGGGDSSKKSLEDEVQSLYEKYGKDEVLRMLASQKKE